MANEDGPGKKDVLGHSRIFTPEVINDIHIKAELGRYRMRGFSIFKPMPHWDELVFLPGTLRFVIEGLPGEVRHDDRARRASRRTRSSSTSRSTSPACPSDAVARGEDGTREGRVHGGTATCSGEGGMIPPERDYSTKWYYQCIQSRYGFNRTT